MGRVVPSQKPNYHYPHKIALKPMGRVIPRPKQRFWWPNKKALKPMGRVIPSKTKVPVAPQNGFKTYVHNPKSRIVVTIKF